MMLAGIEGRVLRSFRRVGFFIILACVMNVMAFRVTINSTVATGEGNYQTFDELLNEIQNNGLSSDGNDSVIFTDNEQVTFQATKDPNSTTSIGQIAFVATQEDPDKFPIINHTAGNWFNLFNKKNVVFERLQFTGTTYFSSGHGVKERIFRNCVIRDFTVALAATSTSFLYLEGNDSSSTIFENCLFSKNLFSKGAVYLAGWPTKAPSVQIRGCTFHNTDTVFSVGNGYKPANTTIINSIISGNNAIYIGTIDIRPLIRLSLIQDSVLTNYGEDCRFARDPYYVVASGKTKPSDYRLSDSSTARGMEKDVTSLTTDISGGDRFDNVGKTDAGCWDFVDPPLITTHPADLTVNAGDRALFRVVATSSASLSYNWFRLGTPEESLSTTDSLVMPAAALSNDSTHYYCVVSHGGGSTVSDTALLRVVSKPVFTAQPESVLAYAGDTARFTVTVAGSAITYSWKRDGELFTGGLGSSSAQLSLPDVDLDDNGSVFVCFAENSIGIDSSREALLTVVMPGAKIVEKTNDTIFPMGNQFTLRVVAQGRPEISYAWKKAGESLILSTADTLQLTEFTANQNVTYRCVVTNGEGTDSADIRVCATTGSFFNPLVLRGKFVDPERAELTLSNFGSLPVSETSSPHVKEIGIWYSTVTFPVGAELSGNADNCVKIDLQRMIDAGGGSFDTTIQFFNGAPEECRSLYIVASPLWKNPDTVVQTVSSDQRTTIFMCPVDSLDNNLDVEVEHERVSDSLTIVVGNVTSINRDSMMYLVIEHGIGYGVNAVVTTDRILPSELEATQSIVSKTYHNERFAQLEDSVTIRVYWRGVMGNFSHVITRKIAVGIPRPVNSATLTADSATMSSIYLHWEFATAPDLDSIRIWWGRSQIALSADIDTATFDFMTFGQDTRNTIITLLVSATRYYIGLQIKKGDVWSLVTVDSRDTCTTFSPTIPNTVNGVTASFNPDNNLITLRWDIDTNGVGQVGNIETGIAWTTGTPPGPAIVPLRIVSELTISGNTLSLDLGEDLQFSSTYHFALALRKKDDVGWTDATELSRAAVAIPTPLWQKIVYFPDEDSIVTAFNRMVVLKKTGSGSVNVTDTLRIFTPSSAPEGFVVVSPIGIDFVKDVKSDPISIGLRYDSALLGSLDAGGIRMYQYNVDGGWRVLDDCDVDPEERLVSVVKRVNDYKDPFILMIDTMPPVVTVISDTVSAVTPQQGVVDSVVVQDNISNCSVELTYWTATANISDTGSYTRCDLHRDTVIMSIPPKYVISDRGLFAQWKISDGRFEKRINVSRVVSPSTADPVVLTANRWMPIFTTATLNDNSIESALDDLKSSDKWSYDSSHFRIYRWIDTTTTSVGAIGNAGWVEYRMASSDLFDLIPGRVVWVKTRKGKTVPSLGTGMTISLREPYSIELKAKEWTDIALPFKFNIRVGDIIDSTTAGVDVALKDSLHIYKWVRGEDDKTAFTQPKYVPKLWENDSLTFNMTYKYGDDGVGTYSVYNASSRDVLLRIPPIPETFSIYSAGNQPAAKKHAADDGWYMVIRPSTDNGRLTPLYCGYRPGMGKCRYPLAPSFGRQSVATVDENNGTVGGSLVLNGPENGGFSFPLLFENSDTKKTVFTYTLAAGSAFPEGLRSGIVDPVSRKVDYSSEQTVAVNAGDKAYRWLVVGDSAFIASLSTKLTRGLALLNVYPNPCRGAVNIKMHIPYSDVKTVQIAFFDQLGRRIWNSTVRNNTLHPGSNTFVVRPSQGGGWSAGSYILRVSAVNSSGKCVGVRQQRVLYLP